MKITNTNKIEYTEKEIDDFVYMLQELVGMHPKIAENDDFVYDLGLILNDWLCPWIDKKKFYQAIHRRMQNERKKNKQIK